MIKKVAHVIQPINDGIKLINMIRENVESMQKDNLVVEIQYQQSDYGISALIIGRANVIKALDSNDVSDMLKNIDFSKMGNL